MSIFRKAARKLLPATFKSWLARYWTAHHFAPLINIGVPPVEQHSSPYPSWIGLQNPLVAMGEKHIPTKRYHNYLPHYWAHFRDIREQVQSVLEIGVETGRSLRMWEEFFPNAVIYGIDYRPECKKQEAGRVKIFVGDQSNVTFLEACLTEMHRPPDIVVDDGSHRIKHQIASFNYLFPRLTDHGIYVVEDTGACVGDTRLRTVNRLKGLIDAVYYWPLNRRGVHWTNLVKFSEEASWLANNVTGIAFYRWIVFIMRGHNPSDNPYLPVDDPLVIPQYLIKEA